MLFLLPVMTWKPQSFAEPENGDNDIPEYLVAKLLEQLCNLYYDSRQSLGRHLYERLIFFLRV